MVHPLCQECLVEKKNLMISNSRIPNAGLGLFAYNRYGAPEITLFERGNCIAPYLGQVLTYEEFAERYIISEDGEATVAVPYGMRQKDMWVDAATYRGPASYANHSTRPNAILVNGSAYGFELVALRDILNGEEITVDYGRWHFTSYKPRYCIEPTTFQRRKRKGSFADYEFIPVRPKIGPQSQELSLLHTSLPLSQPMECIE